MLCFLLACSLHVERNVVVENDTGYAGSGVVLQTGLVLTNAHLIGDETYVDNKLAQVVKYDEKLDLALLRVKTGQFKKVRFGHIKTGQPVHYVGNPGPFHNLVSRGYVLVQDEKHIITDTLPMGGMSGGGLWDEKGHLVGLDEGYYVLNGAMVAIQIPADVIRRFLQ